MGLFDMFKKKAPEPEMQRYTDNYGSGINYGDGTGFTLCVEDVFVITGRGVVVVGQVKGDSVMLGDTLNLMSDGVVIHETKVKGIEMNRKLLDVAEPGMNVGLLLSDINRSDVQAGDILTKK